MAASDGLLDAFPPELDSSLEISAERVWTWPIEDWQALPPQIASPTYTLGNQNWQLSLFPQGSEGYRNAMSLFVKRADDPSTLQDICVQFVLVLHNPNDIRARVAHRVNKRFTAATTDWGYKNFVDLRSAVLASEDGKPPLIDNNATCISFILRIIDDPTGLLWMEDFSSYDSRKHTGYIGLMNQGATCYLNSLLQSLYFTSVFRQTVYEIPAANDHVTQQIQTLFYLLKTSAAPISTLPLTQSFGWDSADAFTQHDVQELNRVLMDKLESSMKGTKVEGFLNNIFVGQMKSYIKCINVDFESSRIEDFWDIQLNVKGMKNVYASFDNYVEVEVLDGENQYSSGDYGLQDARKGVIFEKLPPVLHLQLKRYDYDFMHDTEVKINDRYEFPLDLDLTKYVENANEKYEYELHGVLVHSGDLNVGHYYALLRPTEREEWFRFDDDRVTPALLHEVLEENYGGPRSITSAYMLVYIQKSKTDFVLGEEQEKVPAGIEQQVQSQQRQEEEQRQQELEQRQNIAVQLLSSALIAGHTDLGIMNWEDENFTVTARRDTPLVELAAQAYSALRLNEESAADASSDATIWLASIPDGSTVQLHLISGRYLQEQVEHLAQWSSLALPLVWVEEKRGDPDNESLVFIKEFDGAASVLLGSRWIPKNAPAAEISELPIYMESRGQLVPYKPIPHLTGSVLVLDKFRSPGKLAAHYRELQNTVVVNCFRAAVQPQDGDEESGDEEKARSITAVRASLSDSYAELSARIGEALGAPPENLSLIPYAYVRQYSNGKWVQQPPLKSDGTNMDSLWNSINDGQSDKTFHIMYRVLDQPLASYERLVKLNLYWFEKNHIHDGVVPVSISADVDTTVAELVAEFVESMAITAPARMWVSPELKSVYSVDPATKARDLYAQRSELYLAPEWPNAGEDAKSVTVFHYTRDTRKTHGVPFKAFIPPGTTLGRFCEFLQGVTDLHGKTFEKVKLTHEPQDGLSSDLADPALNLYDLVTDGDEIGLNHPPRRRSVYPQQSIIIK